VKGVEDSKTKNKEKSVVTKWKAAPMGTTLLVFNCLGKRTRKQWRGGTPRPLLR
jgi:hypothetical protein